MRSTYESQLIDDVIKLNLHLDISVIERIFDRKQISVSKATIVSKVDWFKRTSDFSMVTINTEWKDNTPTNHRLTKTYRQLIKNEFSDGEVVGKKAN